MSTTPLQISSISEPRVSFAGSLCNTQSRHIKFAPFLCCCILEVLVFSQCAFLCNLFRQTSRETKLLLPCQSKSNKNIAVGHLNASKACSLGKRLTNLASRCLCFYNYCILFCHLAFFFSFLAYLMVSGTSEDLRHLEKYSRKPVLTPRG